MGKVVTGDRTVAPLIKAVFVLCMFLIFGLILNYISSKTEKEYHQKTAMRITLIREEYERKMGDLKLRYKGICEQKMQEITASLKKFFINELSKYHSKSEQKNQTDLIQTINSELKKILNDDQKNDAGIKRKGWQTAFDKIDKNLQDLKSRILGQNQQESNVVENGNILENSDFIVFTKLTKKLEELLEEMKD